MDFEKEALPAVWPRFDLILCLDVLEHMLDPWRVIDLLVTQQLAAGGTLLVSLPNVRHYSVTAPLVFQGRWNYAEAGILDRTHVRFFTRQSAAQLLTHPRLDGPRFLATNFSVRTRRGIFNVLTAGKFNEFVTYQHLVSARALN
jgi:hypothetical protein